MLNFVLFDTLKYLIWDAAFNLSLISEAIEAMLIFSGVASVSITVINNVFINTIKRQACGYSVARIK
jgi:hypothetical protein